MRIQKIYLATLIAAFAVPAINAADVMSFKLYDGETVEGRLSLPTGSQKVKLLVIYVHGTGPSTYLKTRGMGPSKFNYFDYFADEFNRRKIAFFTYNKRGVTISDDPPNYEFVDREKFRKAVPSAEVRDLATYISELRRIRRLKGTKVVLLGWSEGTVLAAMAAEDKRNKITALFLNGYVHDNMTDVIRWQNTGGSSMANLRPIFDSDRNGSIAKGEYESEEKPVAEFRTRVLQGAKFAQIDVDNDGAITTADFKLINQARYRQISDAIEKGDEDWIWKNYFRISIPWLREHDALEANKDRLLRLKLPIYVLHGEDDGNCPVEGVYDLRNRFNRAGKKNLHDFVFAKHDHDLNFVHWLSKKVIPEGIGKMFEIADELNR